MTDTAASGTLWSTITLVGVFVVLLALVPAALRWAQQRGLVRPGGSLGDGKLGPLQVVQALAVGPQQRVVTVEVGPPQGRVWLVLGVTAHSVNTLHVVPQHGAMPAQLSGAASFTEALRQQQVAPDTAAVVPHDVKG